MRSFPEYNKYLFFEFGFDVEGYNESEISETWPFNLNLLVSDEVFGIKTVIYEFADEEEQYFLIDGTSLTFYKKAGLSVDELKWQLWGAVWIGDRDPLDLNTSRIGYEGIPSIPERKKCIQTLWEGYFPGESMRILEGLYLQTSKEYLALVESITSDVTAIIGSQTLLPDIQWKHMSAWRILALGVGKLLLEGKLKP